MSVGSGPLHLDATVTECGDTLMGTAVESDRSAPTSVRVALRYHVHGGARPDAIDVSDVGGVEVVVDPALGGRFAIDVPKDGPISYEGCAFSVEWSVELSVAGAVVASMPITVLPDGGLAVWAQTAGGPPSPTTGP